MPKSERCAGAWLCAGAHMHLQLREWAGAVTTGACQWSVSHGHGQCLSPIIRSGARRIGALDSSSGRAGGCAQIWSALPQACQRRARVVQSRRADATVSGPPCRSTPGQARVASTKRNTAAPAARPATRPPVAARPLRACRRPRRRLVALLVLVLVLAVGGSPHWAALPRSGHAAGPKRVLHGRRCPSSSSRNMLLARDFLCLSAREE
jgi:hypothetical protein